MVEYAMMGGFLALVTVFVMMLVGNLTDGHLGPILEVGGQLQAEAFLPDASKLAP